MTLPWRIAFTTLAAAVLWLTGFAFGRRHRPAPPPAEAKAHVDEKVSAEAKTEQRAVEATAAARATHTRRTRKLVVGPGGVQHCEETVERFTDTRQAAAAASQATRTESVAQTREVFVRVVQAPRWSLGLMGGVNGSALAGQDRRWWLGASTTHAFVGPLRWGLAIVKVQDQPVFVGAKVEVTR